MAETIDSDWRVTEGPAFGREPEFDLSDIRLHANFYVTGSMSRGVTAVLRTATPTVVESLGRRLSGLSGVLRIFDARTDRAPLTLGGPEPVESGSERGVLWLASPDRYVVDLHLPPEQFGMLLPLLAPAPAAARLTFEVERTVDQGVFEEDIHFWNDRVSPVILFNEFAIRLPGVGGGA